MNAGDIKNAGKDIMVIRANRLFFMCIVFEVAGILVIPLTGMEGAQVVIYAVTLCYAIRTMNMSKIKPIISVRTVSPGKLIHAVSIAICGVPVAMLLNALGSLFSGQTGTGAEDIRTIPIHLATLVYAFIPAIVEEFVFRGVIFEIFSRHDVSTGILVSSLFFALLHFSPGAVLYGFLFGCLFAAVYHATENLIYPITMHCAFNMNNVILSFIDFEKIPIPVMVGAFITGSLLFAILVWLFFRREIRWGKERPEILTVITKEGIVSVGICIVIISFQICFL